MNLTSYIKNLFIIVWNIIALLCPIFAPHNPDSKKKLSFSAFQHIDMYFYNIYLFLKKLKKKIIINKKNKADVTSAQTANKNKKQALNMLGINNQVSNNLLNLLKSLSYKILKDAPATQNLISNLKQHFIPLGAMVVVYQSLLLQLDLSYIKACSHDLKKVMTITQDKCAYLYPFCKQKSLQSINL